MWHMTRDTGHVTHDMWHKTHDTWHIVWELHSLKISAPYLFWFGIDSVLNIFHQTISLPYWVTKLFVEQPRLHWVC